MLREVMEKRYPDAEGMNGQSKIAACIEALLVKTVEHGCAEDEAMVAIAKAAELMAEH